MASRALRNLFWFLNRVFMVPAFRLGLGPLMGNPFSGYIMVLKIIGRKTGRLRYAPVNYSILDGNVYCLAGFGATSQWYRNLRAQPHIEIILPSGALAGIAEDVTDPGEALRVTRQVLKNAGFAGFFLGCNPFTASDAILREKAAGIPVIRIRPIGLGNGAADPGGWLWITATVCTLAVIGIICWMLR